MAATVLRNKVLILLSVCLLALSLCFLSGCGASKQMYEFGQGKVTVEGKDLIVELKSNGSTGYEWIFEIEGTNVKNTAGSYVEEKSDKAAVGTSGIQTYKFQGVGTGNSKITFTYARSWESAAPENTVTMDLTVKGDVIEKSVTKCSDGTGGQSSK